jgi:sugar phosphate isomerase/epimerase
MLSRRDLGKLALAALPLRGTAAKKIDSVVHGVQFGLQTYVFSGIGLPQDGILDIVVKSMVASQLGECELYAPLVVPADVPQAREEQAKWRMSVSLDHFRAIRRKFEDAGIQIYAISGFPASTDAELNRTFEIAGALGARQITLGVTLSAAARIAPLVEMSGFQVGIQGRPNMHATTPDAISTPENYDAAVSLSKSYWVSLDIGDATGGGYDALKFVETHHDRIALLYLKDRRKDRVSVPWGEGDTPIREILRLIVEHKNPIRCYIDCDYKPANRPADVQRSYEYAKAAVE